VVGGEKAGSARQILILNRGFSFLTEGTYDRVATGSRLGSFRHSGVPRDRRGHRADSTTLGRSAAGARADGTSCGAVARAAVGRPTGRGPPGDCRAAARHADGRTSRSPGARGNAPSPPP